MATEYSDIEQYGKKFRIICEEPSLSHPDVFIVEAFELKKDGVKSVFRHAEKFQNKAWMMDAARTAINKAH